MSYMLNVGAHSEPNVEVHKFYSGTIVGTVLLALVFQAFLHKYGRWSELIDLPLLVTIYFGVSRRNPVSGLFLGGAIGILQDALSHDNPIGMYGIAKTLVGYLASSVGARIDTEHPLSRFGLIFLFFHFHQAILARDSARFAEPLRAILHFPPLHRFSSYRGIRGGSFRSPRPPAPQLLAGTLLRPAYSDRRASITSLRRPAVLLLRRGVDTSWQ